MNLLRRFRFCSSTLTRLQNNLESRVSTLTLANPKKRNCMSESMLTQLMSQLSAVESQITGKKIKMLVLKGQGPVFSSGHDLKEINSSLTNKQELWQGNNTIFHLSARICNRIRSLSVPTICAIDGIAAAGGLQLALSCDLVIATQKSLFSTPGIKWGLFCSTPAVELIRAVSSSKKTNEMLLFGEPVTAEEAERMGMLTKVVRDGQHLQDEIKSYEAKINKLSSSVIALGKQALSKQSSVARTDQAYEIATYAMTENLKSKECQSGLQAFVDKKHASFSD